MPDLLTLPMAAIEAAAGKPPRLKIVAYTGGVMGVAGYGPLVIDLAGLELPERVTLLADHANELGAIVGSGRPKVQGGRQLIIDGTLADETDAGKQVLNLLAAGVQLRASVGGEVKQRQFVREGESVKANGLEHKAPSGGLSVVTAGILRETSIVAVGADGNTSVSLAAAAAMNGVSAMSGTGPKDDPIQAERERVKRINAMFGERHVATRDRCIEAGLDLEHAELEFLRAEQNVAKLEASYRALPNVQTIRKDLPAGMRDRDVLACAILAKMGFEEIGAKQIGERPQQVARELGVRHVLDIVAHCLRLNGLPVPAGKQELVQAGFSTLSLPVALGDATNKVALDFYKTSPATYPTHCKISPTANFRAVKMVRVNWSGEFQEVPDGGELKHGSIGESVYQATPSTYGQIFGVTRKDLYNDDLQALSNTGQALGQNGRRKVQDLVTACLLGNAADFFGEAHRNFEGGSNSALGFQSLARAVQMMREQIDQEGHAIDIGPRVLLVPPALETVARQLVLPNPLQPYPYIADEQLPTGNPWAGKLDVQVEPRLSNVKFAGCSSKGWYLFSDAANGAMHVVFVDGRDAPIVEQVQPPPEYLGLMFRGYVDVGVTFGDPAAAVFMVGENVE